MRLVKQCWDFAFGFLLIGSAPLGVFGVVLLLLGLIERLLGVSIPESVCMAARGFGWLLAFVAFIAAIWYRLRHRLIHVGFAVIEAVLAVVADVMLMAVCAMQHIR